jgi:hypothetical protein
MTPRRPTARARAVAEAVTPIIADARALQRQLAACGRRVPRGRRDAAPLLGAFAEQMRASADLLAARVREVGGLPCTRDSDGAGRPAASGPARRARGDTFRRLLADEDEVADRLRRAIATCDAHTDEGTASCLEEVLDEVELQRAVLRGLVPPGGAARPGAARPGAA